MGKKTKEKLYLASVQEMKDLFSQFRRLKDLHHNVSYLNQ